MAIKKAKAAKKSRAVEKTDLLSSAELHCHDSHKHDDHHDSFTAIYVVIILGFISLLVYVTQMQGGEKTGENFAPTPTAEELRAPATTDHFGCNLSERMDSAENQAYTEKYLKDNCDLGRPFSMSSSLYGEYKAPKSIICCWKK